MTDSFDLGGSGNSFPFDAIGDTVTGTIIAIEQQQQTDMESGLPAVWDNGAPKLMVKVELQTQLRDPADPSDDGKRSVYLKGSRKPESMSSMAAVLGAVRAASGATTLQQGGTLTLTFAGEGVPSRRGYSAPKHYTATYVPAPPAQVDLSGAQPASAAPPAAQAPTPAPAPVQQAPAPAAAVPNLSDEQKAAFLAWQASQQQAG